MWSMSHAFPASIFWAQTEHVPFLCRNRFSLEEVEKVGRRTVRVMVPLVCSADALPFNVRLLLIAILRDRAGPGKVFHEVDFTTGIKLGEGQSFSWSNREATPAVRAERLLSDPAYSILK
jgi:hypothetical protein